jgi:hypothetical protein
MAGAADALAGREGGNDRVTAEGRRRAIQMGKHVQEENAKAAEFIPDLADKAKSEALTKRVATELLPELGFKDSELADLANGNRSSRSTTIAFSDSSPMA